MTLPRLDALKDYQLKSPPVHWLVASYMKYKPPEKQEIGNVADLIKALGG
jgi:hypothetical protein